MNKNITLFEIYRNGWLLVARCDEHFVTTCLRFCKFEITTFGYSCFKEKHDKPRIKVRQVASHHYKI